MSRDARDLLHRAASMPNQPPDLNAIRRRGRTLSLTRAALLTMLVAAAGIGGIAVVLQIVSEPTTVTAPSNEPAIGRVGCEFRPPQELPSGADPGQAALHEGEGGVTQAVWGGGQDEVIQVTGGDVLAQFDESDFDFSDTVGSQQLIEVGGEQRLVLPVGDPPDSHIVILFVADDCPYAFWMRPGFELSDAIDYASRF